MFPSKALLSFVLVSLTTAHAIAISRSTGKATLPLAAKLNKVSTQSILQMDQARAKALRSPGTFAKSSPSDDVANAVMTYTVQVGVGTPPTDYTLVVDTGSSNVWVGASKPYTPTSTSKDTGDAFAIVYGSAFAAGEEWTDTVALTPALTVENQSIGVANSSAGLHDWDGILGLGPVDLTAGTVINTNTVPTVPDNLLSQGKISEEVIGIHFVPVSEKVSNGTVTFGGIDHSALTGAVEYVPLTTTSPASEYWGIDQSITYGHTTILSSTAGIVDTGTTLILIATDAFNAYQSATGGVLDPNTNLLSITRAQYAALKPLQFHIGGKSYELSPNAQIWPRALNSAAGGTDGSIYLIVGDIGSPSGSGLDFINGFTFLERYYSVYDTTHKRVGFAPTTDTYATTN